MSELAAIQSAIELMFAEMFTLQGYTQITVTLEAVTRRRRLESGSVNVNVAIVFATAAEATSAANDLNNGALSSPAALQSRLNNQFQSGPSPLGITTTGRRSPPQRPVQMAPLLRAMVPLLRLLLRGTAVRLSCRSRSGRGTWRCVHLPRLHLRVLPPEGPGPLLSNPRAGARTGVEAHTQSTAERAMSVVSYTAQQQQMQQMQMQMQAAPPQQITVVIPPVSLRRALSGQHAEWHGDVPGAAGMRRRAAGDGQHTIVAAAAAAAAAARRAHTRPQDARGRHPDQ